MADAADEAEAITSAQMEAPEAPAPGPILTRQRREQLRMLAEYAMKPGHRGVVAAEPTCGEVLIPATWLVALLGDA